MVRHLAVRSFIISSFPAVRLLQFDALHELATILNLIAKPLTTSLLNKGHSSRDTLVHLQSINYLV